MSKTFNWFELTDLTEKSYALEFLSDSFCEVEILLERGTKIDFDAPQNGREANGTMYGLAATRIENFAVVVKSTDKV